MSRHKFATPPRARQLRGVSLVEVLVSVLVVTLGLLGAAALQATALRNNQGSYERTQVSILSQSIFDAMRANLAGVRDGSYNSSDWVCAAPQANSLAASDTARWINTLQGQIHGGACGSIECAAGVCTVSVRWDDSRATAGDSAQVVTMRAQL
jgi:type IV pilus assembly protein PilV